MKVTQKIGDTYITREVNAKTFYIANYGLGIVLVGALLFAMHMYGG